MTIEDFFTLTEMKDGLTVPARVEELINVMQKEKGSVVKNISDATRQWSTVASTIAATENTDCLNLFIQLDGLWFIDRWLKDAQKFGNDTGDSFAEESVIALLRAIQKLHIDYERSISSGIWTTVKDLVDHSSTTVEDQARALFERWNLMGDSNKAGQENKNVDGPLDAAVAESTRLTEGSALKDSGTMDVPLSKKSSNVENHLEKAASSDSLPTGSLSHTERFEEVQNRASIDRANSHPLQLDGEPSVPLGPSVVTNSVGEKLAVAKDAPTHVEGQMVSIEICSSPVSENSENPKLNEVTGDGNHTSEMKTPAREIMTTSKTSASYTVHPGFVSVSADASTPPNPVTKFSLSNKVDSKVGESCIRNSSQGNAGMLMTEPKSDMKHFRSTLGFETVDHGRDYCSSVLQDSSLNVGTRGKNEEADSSSSTMEDIEGGNKSKEQSSNREMNRASDCLKPTRNTKDCMLADMELEYGLVDALEVARKVAKEVTREVVHCKESFSSTSSEKNSSGNGQPCSPDSIHGNEDQLTECPPVEVPSELNLSPRASPGKEEHISSDNLEGELGNCKPVIDSCQDIGTAKEPEVNAEDSCGFDLNLDVCTEESEGLVSLSTATVSVVSASRPAAAAGLPGSPLQFVGTFGWKGSAATSAFRPASPRRVSDDDKTPSLDGACSSSKQRQNFLDIDLNVAEGADNEISNPAMGKQAFVLPGLSSGESSVEASPRRSERLNLDLNRIDDDGNALPSERKVDVQLLCPQNGHQSASPASSSSSMRPAVRNIDLNDPSFGNDSSENKGLFAKPLSENASVLGATKPSDPVISLMGMRVEVSRKEFTPQTLSPWQNGSITDPAIGTSLGRMASVLGLGPSAPYTHPPPHGFNGLAAGPSMSFSSPMYGPGGSVPYMVDSKGTHVVPQIVPSASAVSSSYSQPSFVMSMTGSPLTLNGAGPSRSGFDLNSGFVTEGGSRDSGGLRQLFGHNASRLMEEHPSASSQASLSLGIGEKRKEPEAGWELYPFGNKRQQPPW